MAREPQPMDHRSAFERRIDAWLDKLFGRVDQKICPNCGGSGALKSSGNTHSREV